MAEKQFAVMLQRMIECGRVFEERLISNVVYPFSNMISTIQRIMAGSWKLPSERVPGIPNTVDDLVKHMMALRIDARLATATAVIAKLEAVLVEAASETPRV